MMLDWHDRKLRCRSNGLCLILSSGYHLGDEVVLDPGRLEERYDLIEIQLRFEI
jgi:hypothetical protein